MTFLDRQAGMLGRQIGKASFPIALALSALFAVAAVAAPTTPKSDSEPAYTVTDLGPLSHIADDVSMQINQAGQVSMWDQTPSMRASAVIWNGKSRQTLKSLAGYLTSIASTINDKGQVGGWMGTGANLVDSQSTLRGVIYTKGAPRLLGTLGGRDSRVNGINNSGAAVGVADLANKQRHAFIDKGKKMTDLGTLPGGEFSEAFAINAAGEVAGVASVPATANQGSVQLHAVVWKNGRIQDLGTLPGGKSSSAHAINDKGQVAGYGDADNEVHAFLATNGKMIDLGDLGDDPSTALGLNNNGDVVGASNVIDVVRHAFLWRHGKMTDLNTLVPKTEWSLFEADSINDQGQIVCVGHSVSGIPHALLLTPLRAVK